MNKKEKIFRDNSGDDFIFILSLSILFAILFSKLATILINEMIEVDAFTLGLIDILIYIVVSLLFIAGYYIKKFEEIE
ncbi:MAG: hypothetical protein KAS66_03995 [Candidatus Omnitrophica bacterium]|nr:hypothetical protein [Candidatus Omnitrophota bacterium]